MSYEVMLASDGSHIRIRVLKNVTGDLEIMFSGAAIEEARKYGLWKFLADVRGVRNVASALEQYRLGYDEMYRLALDRTSKIAILADVGDDSHDFVETILRNAGFMCRLFTDEPSALKWLEVERTA